MSHKKNVLLIDVGNTNIIIGFSNENSNITSFRFNTNKSATIDDFAIKLDFSFKNLKLNKNDLDLTLISSVVPEINEILAVCIQKYLGIKAKFVHEIEKNKLGIKINYKNPDEIGSDRLVNAIAAIKLYGYPCMIVDIGTAATIDFINEDAEYIGGAILPGIGMTINALSSMTSKLPKIDFKKSSKLIGEDTKESIQSGIYHGFLGSIDYFRNNYNKKNNKVILTGGYTEVYEKEAGVFDIIDKDITMKGLNIIAER